MSEISIDAASHDATSTPIVFENAGTVFANTRDVAAFFGKRHDNVVKATRNLIAEMAGVLKIEEIDPSRRAVLFRPAEYLDDRGRFQPCYDMDRGGFTLLAMGFTGPDALRFKLRYIEAFDRMEAALKRLRALDVDEDGQPGKPSEAMQLRKVAETRLTWGELPAQQMWLALGLQTVPAMFAPPRQPGLFDYKPAAAHADAPEETADAE